MLGALNVVGASWAATSGLAKERWLSMVSMVCDMWSTQNPDVKTVGHTFAKISNILKIVWIAKIGVACTTVTELSKGARSSTIEAR